tara:strand:+ start:448 stop:1245 length:798 start_codon:yes stop_codon:yes gene_type:complete
MKIVEIESGIKVMNTANNLDKVISKTLPEPFPNTSGFSWLICGSSGSGKTTLLYDLMTKKDKEKTSYRKVFHKIFLVSPTMGKSSIKKDPFSTVPKGQVWRELTLDVLHQIEDAVYEERDEEHHSVVIFDDVGSQLRKSKAIELKMSQMLQNRRHAFCSYFILLQKYKDVGTGIRCNLSHFTTFRFKSNQEKNAVRDELFPMIPKEADKVIDYVFENPDDKHTFLYMDMSLKKRGTYIYYKEFNELVITESTPKEKDDELIVEKI